MLTRALAFVVVVTALGCEEPARTDKLTVVVEADRARAEEDQARLRDMQRSLDDAKRDLTETRQDLAALRERLLKAGAITADEAEKLTAREELLFARERALPGSSPPAAAPPAGLTRADVEELLRAQEERLRASLPPSTAAAPGGPTPDDVAAELAAAAKLRNERGLRADDVAGGPALERRVTDALAGKRQGDALAAARDLVSATNKTVVTLGFVKKKYDRANALLSSSAVSAEAKPSIKKLLGEATAAIGNNDVAGANEKLNAALDLR